MQTPFDPSTPLFFPLDFNHPNYNGDALPDGEDEDEHSEASGGSNADHHPAHNTPIAQPPRSQSSPVISSQSATSGPTLRKTTQPLSEKRKMQNRAAQKSFRERRDRYLKDLEEKVANQSDVDAQTNARIRNLEAENAALRRLLSQSILPPGSQLAVPDHSQPLWPDSALLNSGRPASASSSEVDLILNHHQALDGGSDSASLSTASSASLVAPLPAPFPSMGTPSPFPGTEQLPNHGQSHFSVLEDVDVVDWRYAWAQLCSHPQYAEVDRDELWQDLRKHARYCVDKPPVIQAEALHLLQESISQRVRKPVSLVS